MSCYKEGEENYWCVADCEEYLATTIRRKTGTIINQKFIYISSYRAYPKTSPDNHSFTANLGASLGKREHISNFGREHFPKHKREHFPKLEREHFPNFGREHFPKHLGTIPNYNLGTIPLYVNYYLEQIGRR